VRKVQSLFVLETEAKLHIRCFKEECNDFENICVALCGIVEPGSVNQNDTMSIQMEGAGSLYRICTRL
jgi:hypothetical protein